MEREREREEGQGRGRGRGQGRASEQIERQSGRAGDREQESH